MKIRVFKLNWIEQKNLKFDAHEMHSGQRKGDGRSRPLSTSPWYLSITDT